MTGEVSNFGAGSHPKCMMVANIFISFIGAGILGLPKAFKTSGLIEGSIVMSVVAFLAVRAMLLLIDCKDKLEESAAKGNNGPTKRKPKGSEAGRVVSNGKEYVQLPVADLHSDDGDAGADVAVAIATPSGSRSSSPSLPKMITYGDVGYAACGNGGRILVEATLLVSQVGFCCSYLIFIARNLATFVYGVSDQQWQLMLLPPLFLLTLIPDLSNLAVFSFLAQLSNLFAFLVVFYFDFEHFHLASNEHRKEFSLSGFPFFFAVAIYCYEGAGMILSLEQSVTDEVRPLFRKYFVATIVCITAGYVLFGTAGYLSFGPETKDIITLNLPQDTGLDFAVIVKSCLCFSLFFTYPIMMFPVTGLLEEKIAGTGYSGRLSGYLIRIVLVGLTGVVVHIIPCFSQIMGFIGATCCTFLAFIMPAVCHMVLFKKSDEKTVWFNRLLVATGVVGFILGSIDAVSKILEPDDGTKQCDS